MCTIGPWGPLSPSNPKPREVAQLDATIGTVQGEYSFIYLSEPVGKILLRAFGIDKAEVTQCCVMLSECTVLNFQCHRLCELAGCCDPEDRADEV